MQYRSRRWLFNACRGTGVAAAACLVVALLGAGPAPVAAAEPPPPQPLLSKGEAVKWWFVFKLNSSKPFAGCFQDSGDRTCPFGGVPLLRGNFGQQFAFASEKNATLQPGVGCLGAQMTDPVGATFDEVFNGDYFYVVWNDQFYGDPHVCGSAANCTGRWGHSKGILAWNNDGEGLIMQVTTPSWPGSGSKHFVRKTGNTLGCVKSNNNLIASQHFFSLKLNKKDLLAVLHAMEVASVATDVKVGQVVRNGGPQEVRAAVLKLGKTPAKSDKFDIVHQELEVEVNKKKVILIAKPSNVNVPPWQMVSALLSGAPARAATWWTKPKIASSLKTTKVKCWSDDVKADPGPVAIALTGQWEKSEIKLYAPSNHAKIGIATAGDKRYAIFGDLNQQGSLSPPPDCNASQNGRGGMFFVLQDPDLFASMQALIDGDTAPAAKK